MRTAWIIATAIAGLAAQAAHADAYCGNWGSDELRCLARNNARLAHDFTFHLSRASPSSKQSYKADIDMYPSSCGFPGILETKHELDSTKSDPLSRGLTFTENISKGRCVEYYAVRCESPIGTRRHCNEVINMTVQDLGIDR